MSDASLAAPVEDSAAANEPWGKLDEACHRPILARWESLAAEVDEGLVAVLRDGIARHEEILESTGLRGDAPDEWEVRADRLLEYRRAVATGLLEPLLEPVEGRGPAIRTAAATTEAVRASLEACAGLPAEAAGLWPRDALAPLDSDRLSRRLGKVVARGVSAARRAGTERTVPLCSLALRHLTERVAPRLDRLTEESMVRWAAWTRELEIAWSDWGEAVLPALVRAELPSAEDVAELWATVREGADTLNRRLEALAGSAPAPENTRAAQAVLEDCRELARADLAIAGSFLLRLDHAEVREPRLPRVTTAQPALDSWEDGVAARMRLYLAVLAILAGATGVQRRLLSRFRKQCLGEVRALPEIAGRLENLTRSLADDGGREGLEGRLESLTSAVESALAPARAAVPDSALVDETIVQGADSTVEGLLAVIRQAPATLPLHEEGSKLPSSRRQVETRALPLQELARQSFDALRIERIRGSTLGLVSDIDEMRSSVADLPEVFSFAYEAARIELEEDEDGAEERAVGLVSEALQSMADSLRNQLAKLETDVDEAQTRLAAEISEGALGLVDRVAAGRMQAQLLAARSQFADLRARLSETLRPHVERGVRRLTLLWTRARRLVSRGVRRGSELVTGPTSEQADASRTVRTLADARVLVERLPLVYQRLFTLAPISDAALLAGRSAELADALGRWRRWRAEDGVPLLVRGRQGSGITSLIKVLAAQIEEQGATVASFTLHHRITAEAELAAELAEVLGLEATDTLDELARAVFRAEMGSLPDAAAIDNLEHLYVRVPGGTALIERLLTFMAETEPRTFWIGGITTSAWQMVSTAEPTAVSQVDVLELRPLSPEGIREAIEVRHRRSGLAVRFEEPEQGRRLLKRRLRRMRDAEGYQQLLEDDYFHQLGRTSDGHLQLALFQWLMSAEFGDGGGVLMRPPERPDFGVLDALDLTQNFTLKAFLEHRTLTMAEHDQIFRLPRQESYQIFESLGNRHLIEAVVDDDDSAARRSEIEEGFRYRVRPLLSGAVLSHLRGRNIVH